MALWHAIPVRRGASSPSIQRCLPFTHGQQPHSTHMYYDYGDERIWIIACLCLDGGRHEV